MHGVVGALAGEHVEQIATVSGFHERLGPFSQLLIVEIAHPPGHLLGSADGQALSLLDGTDELTSGREIV